MPRDRFALGVSTSKWIVWQRSALLGANYVRLSEQAVSMADPPESFYDIAEHIREMHTIRVSKEDASRNESSARTPRNSGFATSSQRYPREKSHDTKRPRTQSVMVWPYEESTLANVELQDLTLNQTVSVTSAPIDLGAGVFMTFLSANGEPRISQLGEPACTDINENDLSLGALISYRDFQEWIAGDISGVSNGDYADIETYVAASIGDIEVLRVNHHGSRYNSNETFLANLDPEVSIISTGVGNAHRHPNPDVIDRLYETSDVYMTSTGTGEWSFPSASGSISIVGEIYITTDGARYRVNGKSYEALAVTRTDADGDGYYANVDPDDSDANSIPAECVTPAGES